MTAPEKHNSVMHQDFKSSLHGIRTRSPRSHILMVLASVAVLAGILMFITNNAKATRNDALTAYPGDDLKVSLPLNIPENISAAQTAPQTMEAEPQAHIDWRSTKVKSGDSLALIFSRMGLSATELHRMMSSDKQTSAFKRLVPGQELRFHIEDNSLQQLVYQMDTLNTLQVTRQDDISFSVSKQTRELQAQLTNRSGEIKSSLFLAGQKAGLSDSLIMELAGIFGWDIDFVLDIREGDSFTVVYEELYLDGRKLDDGNIIAAEFINQGKPYRALRYTNAEGRSDYYSPDGKSMRKAFIRTPVDFTRISSRFGKRKHPTLGTMKNHHGVDYAAPRGTPIKSAGDGKIIFRGNKGGYGKTVIVQHGGRYSTLYAHMSNFKKGVGNGSRVRQGQIIGYVGTTGRSTGPHLHYEFRVDGVHRNPLTVKLPDAAPIQAKYKADFQAKSQGLLAMLDALQATSVALNDAPLSQ